MQPLEKAPVRVLVILLGSIGDVVRGLAVANALKQSGGFHLSWVVEPKSAAIVQMSPDVDDVIVFERARGVRGFIEVVRDLRRRKFDVVFDMQRHLKSGALSLLSGSSRRIGFARADAKEFNFLFNNEFIPEWGAAGNRPARSKLHAYLSFLPCVGINAPTEPGWRLDERRIGESTAPPGQAGAIGLVLGSSWESKNWIGMQSLARALVSQRQERIVLLGDRTTAELGASIVGIDPARIESTAGAVGLGGLVSRLRACSVVVGPDSGPGHICAAIGVPYIGLFGPTDPVVTAPHGMEDLVMAARVGCSPCYRRRCPGLGQLCLRLITPAMVLERIESVLGPAA